MFSFKFKSKSIKLIKHQFPSLRFSSNSPSYTYHHIDTLFSNGKPSSLASLFKHQALIITTGNSNNLFLSSKLISLYAAFGKPDSSNEVFASVPTKDVFLWNSIIKSHFSNGNYAHSFRLYLAMQSSNTFPNSFTIPMVVSACAELLWDDCGKFVHGFALKCGFFACNSAVGSSFVYMYAKCGVMSDACLVFAEMPVRDVVAWTALVNGFVRNNESEKGLLCLRDMHMTCEGSERPNYRTLESGLQACVNLGALLEGRNLHGLAVKYGLVNSQSVMSSLLLMYSKWGSPVEAFVCFCEVGDKDLLSWTSVISAYARSGLVKEFLAMFWEMQANEVYPDRIVISCMLSGFGNAKKIYEGRAFHGLLVRQYYLILDEMVLNALLAMYCKFENLCKAENLFHMISKGDIEPWNTMIICYTKLKLEEKCTELFRKMQHIGLKPDSTSLVSAISICSHLGATKSGRSIHGYAVKSYMDGNISVINSLVDMYGKNCSLKIAWKIFSVTQRDVITWNTMISCYGHHGHFAAAVALFDKMISEFFKPNAATLVLVLSACSHLASLEKGRKVHTYIKEEGYEVSLSLGTALVDMYAKCGQLEKSRELFDLMNEKDVISYNVMISGYGMHGDTDTALEIFNQMEKSDVEPNELTFLGLLSACTHAGLVKEGKYAFGRMQHYGLKPNLKHYACMVDLLARSGKLQDAEALVLSMPCCPDGGVWGTLLSSCVIHNDIEMGIRMGGRAIESDPRNSGYYTILSNMYSSTGRWEDANKAREMMKERGIEKKSGHSAG